MRPVALHGVGLAGADTSALAEFVPARALRRIDRYSRMALLASFFALRDAGVERPSPEETGVIVATGYGATCTTFAFLDTVIADGDILASPTCFSTSVHNAAASTISIVIGIHGPTLTVSQFEAPVLSALLTASDLLAEERVKRCLLVAVDEAGVVVEYCHRRAGKGSPKEGAAAFILSPGGKAPAPYGVVLDAEWVAISGIDPALPLISPDPALADLPIYQAWGWAEAARRVRSGEADRVGCLAAGRNGLGGLIVMGPG